MEVPARTSCPGQVTQFEAAQTTGSQCAWLVVFKRLTLVVMGAMHSCPLCGCHRLLLDTGAVGLGLPPPGLTAVLLGMLPLLPA
jgi:hypothetical protein